MTTLGKIGLIVFSLVIPAFIAAFSSSFLATFILLFLFSGLTYALLSVKIIIEYDRGLLFQLGNYKQLLGPGLNIIFPFIEKIIRVTTRIQVADVPPQEIITRDNVPLNINAVGYYRVRDPEQAILNVENYQIASFQISQTTLRSVIGEHEMDEVLTERDKINHQLQQIIQSATDAWGIDFVNIEVKDVELPQNLKRAMAKQAEAERERRARRILAEGEFEASKKLAEAGALIAEQPASLQLRLFQTMQEISAEKNSTILFPFPLELTQLIQKLIEKD